MNDSSEFNKEKLKEFNQHLIKKYQEAGFVHARYLKELTMLETVVTLTDKEYLDELGFFYDKLQNYIKTNKIENVKIDNYNQLKFSIEPLPTMESNLTNLKKSCIEYVNYAMSDEYNDDRASDYEHFIFEEALKSFYGTDIFQKIRLAKAY